MKTGRAFRGAINSASQPKKIYDFSFINYQLPFGGSSRLKEYSLQVFSSASIRKEPACNVPMEAAVFNHDGFDISHPELMNRML
jgi:hypothetical protein